MRERIESLFYASLEGDITRVQQVLEDGYHDVDGDNRWCTDIDPKGWGRSPLHLAIQQGHLGLAKWLLENGADVNRRNRFGDTALTAICRPPLPGHWAEAVELLVAFAADPTIKNDDNESALDYARKIPVVWEKAKTLLGGFVKA
jgi:Ankyrin repeats (many copies)